jgi:hypothetical protein
MQNIMAAKRSGCKYVTWRQNVFDEKRSWIQYVVDAKCPTDPFGYV